MVGQVGRVLHYKQPHRRAFWVLKVLVVIIRLRVVCAALPVCLFLCGVRVGPPVAKGSPGGGFITLVWRAESELVLRDKNKTKTQSLVSN